MRDDRFGRPRAEVLAARFTSTHPLYELVHERNTGGESLDDRLARADDGKAPDATDQRPNTRDMILVHRVYRAHRRGGARADTGRAGGGRGAGRRLADHIGMVLQSPQHHHETEDELLWPLLHQRAPQWNSLLTTMQSQHGAIADGLGRVVRLLAAWPGGGADPSAGAELADDLEAVAGPLNAHLDEGETKLLPICAEHVSVAE